MRLGEYETRRLLGKGGMSEVYEVENVRLGSRHALKLFTYPADDPEVRRRFETEGCLLARLRHPRIVRVTDFGEDGESGRPYFVMDLIQDERGALKPLSDVEPGTVDEETVGRWYDDLREGLAYIHARGVVHRDLKLQNVLIGPDGHAVITDFGISKIFAPAGEKSAVVDTVNTLVKMRDGRSLVMGSVGYMAPELEMGVAASPQSDWYALGVIVYRLLTGSWCDARTDVVGNLETYDPVWKTIVPKLLHANPHGRECLSYAEERRVARERAEFESEEYLIATKGRGRFARHVARGLAVVIVLLAALNVWQRYSGGLQIARLQSELDVPRFETVFAIPEAAGEEATATMPSREQFRAAMVDALVLTQGIFADLYDRSITVAKAKSELTRLWSRSKRRDRRLFLGLPDNYHSSGEDAALTLLLGEAAKRIK